MNIDNRLWILIAFMILFISCDASLEKISLSGGSSGSSFSSSLVQGVEDTLINNGVSQSDANSVVSSLESQVSAQIAAYAYLQTTPPAHQSLSECELSKAKIYIENALPLFNRFSKPKIHTDYVNFVVHEVKKFQSLCNDFADQVNAEALASGLDKISDYYVQANSTNLEQDLTSSLEEMMIPKSSSELAFNQNIIQGLQKNLITLFNTKSTLSNIGALNLINNSVRKVINDERTVALQLSNSFEQLLSSALSSISNEYLRVGIVNLGSTEQVSTLSQMLSLLRDLNIDFINIEDLQNDLALADVFLMINSSETEYSSSFLSAWNTLAGHIESSGKSILLFDQNTSNMSSLFSSGDWTNLSGSRSLDQNKSLNIVPEFIQNVPMDFASAATDRYYTCSESRFAFTDFHSFKILNADDMSNITFIDTIGSLGESSGILSPTLSEQYFYAASYFLHSVNSTNPSSLVYDSSLHKIDIDSGGDGQNWGSGLQVIGNYLYATILGGSNNEALQIYDLTSPMLPNRVNTSLDFDYGAVGVTSSDDNTKLFVADYTNSKIFAYDLSDPQNPVQISEVDTQVQPLWIHQSGGVVGYQGYSNASMIYLVNASTPNSLSHGSTPIDLGDFVKPAGSFQMIGKEVIVVGHVNDQVSESPENDTNTMVMRHYNVSNVNSPSLSFEYNYLHESSSTITSQKPNGYLCRNHLLFRSVDNASTTDTNKLVNLKFYLSNEGGVLNNHNLKTYDLTSINANEGYVNLSSLPAESKALLSSSSQDRVTTFSFPHGNGKIVYSTTPLLDHADTGSGIEKKLLPFLLYYGKGE